MFSDTVVDQPNDQGTAYQVLIVGSGISGTLAATVLGRAGYRVCLVDRHPEYPRDFRAEHLDGGMVELLQRLNLLQDLTEGLYRGETVKLAHHGRVLGDARTLNFGLRYETLVNRARGMLPDTVDVVTGRVTDVLTSDAVQQIRMTDGRSFSGRLIILATGQGYALCKRVGVQRHILRENHSLTFGFDVEPVGIPAFQHSFLVYQRERVEDRIDYLAAFTLGARTRINLFTYRHYREPWTKAFLAAPDKALREVLPGFEPVMGSFRVVGDVEARPIDLYTSEDYIRSGIVLIGDAFQASCPATGMGIFRLLTDIEQLTRAHVPNWLQTAGMGREKIAAFYHDPVKTACDAKALHDAEYRRSVSTELGLSWRIHRTRVQAVEQIQAWRRSMPALRHPRIVEQPQPTSLAAG